MLWITRLSLNVFISICVLEVFRRRRIRNKMRLRPQIAQGVHLNALRIFI